MKLIMIQKGVLASLTLLATIAVSAAPLYKIELVGIGNSNDAALNNNGTVASNPFGAESYLWNSRTGAIPSAAAPDGFTSADPWGINDYNAYVGVLNPPGCCFDTTAFYVDPAGHLIVIDAFSANDVNNHGQVTGLASGGEAYIWDATNGLQRIGKVQSQALTIGYSINDNGVVVGSGYTTQYFPNLEISYTPFKWDPINGLVELDRFGSEVAIAQDINNNNITVGSLLYGDLDNSREFAVYWDQENSIHILPNVEGSTASYRASSINDSDTIVGVSTEDQSSTAILWFDGEAYDINDLIDPDDPLYGTVFFDRAFEVNNSGQILVSESNSDFTEFTSYLLTPVPLPLPAFLFLSSLAALMAVKKSRDVRLS